MTGFSIRSFPTGRKLDDCKYTLSLCKTLVDEGLFLYCHQRCQTKETRPAIPVWGQRTWIHRTAS